MGHVGSRRVAWRDDPGTRGCRLDRLSSRGAPAALLGRLESDMGRLHRGHAADGMLHGDRDVSCDTDGQGDPPADRHAGVAEARHEPTVDLRPRAIDGNQSRVSLKSPFVAPWVQVPLSVRLYDPRLASLPSIT